jgi:hypothetical protein
MLNAVMTYGNARMAGRLLRRGLGGKAATGLMLAYFGKKAFDRFRASRRTGQGTDRRVPT